jgi:hypothetical protein
MTALERVLVRFLTDPDFLDAYKQGKVDLAGEFGLAESEKEMLDTTMSVGDGTTLDAIVNAAERARSHVGTSTKVDVSWAVGMLERVAPKLERVAPTAGGPPLSVGLGRPTASKEGRIEPRPLTSSVGGTDS